MNSDYLTQNRIQQVIINHPWEAYGVDIWEAYTIWLQCLRVTRSQLEDAKRRYLLTYVKPKLPQKAYQELEVNIERVSEI